MSNSPLQDTALGLGVYSLSEASRLTGVSTDRLRRWVRGYQYKNRDNTSVSKAVFASDYSNNSVIQLSFLDLIESKVIDAFLKCGVGWREIRRASGTAAELLSSSHPFATFRFKTDGKQIFAEIIDETDLSLVELKNKQRMFHRIISPSLKNLEFDSVNDHASRWWPLGHNSLVVIDPSKSFGKPATSVSGVPTDILYSHASRSSVAETASWYEVSPREVRDAIKFETLHAA